VKFQGLGVSKGIYEGRARWLDDPKMLHLLEQGEVLVCKTTDPDWGEAFDLAGAVVTMIGSILCHAAIIAREYGLPAVVNIKNIDDFDGSVMGPEDLDGARVRVDGTTGTVEVLE